MNLGILRGCRSFLCRRADAAAPETRQRRVPDVEASGGCCEESLLLDPTSRISLLAHHGSFRINPLHEEVNPYGAGIIAGGFARRMAQADLLAQAFYLDMVGAGWAPTVDTYLNRVPEARILEVAPEAKGAGKAQLLDHLKNGDMASKAERIQKCGGWLREALRRPDLAAVDNGEGQGESGDVPGTEQVEELA